MPKPDTTKNILGPMGTLDESKKKGRTVIFMTVDGSEYQWMASREFAGQLTSADWTLIKKNLDLTMKRVAAQEGNKL